MVRRSPRVRARVASGSDTAESPKRRRLGATAARSVLSTRTRRDAKLGHEENLVGRRVEMADEAFLENASVLKQIAEESKEATQLGVVSVNTHLEENRSAHWCEEYETEKLVVRRGQAFELTITFARNYDPEADTIILQFVTGKRPQESKGTVRRLEVHKEQYHIDRWCAQLLNIGDKTANVRVMTRADAIVGQYSLYVETVAQDADGVLHHRYKHDDDIYLLFNPWAPEDDVYIEDEAEREEYVLNETGSIWVGNWRRYGPLNWNYAQFEDVSLETALYLLDKAELGSSARSNPCQVIRVLSAMVNCNDEDGGVLEGRWTKTYPSSSTPPTAWTGSGEILGNFADNDYKAVKYGQCWVFAGLCTTLARALGIPTRPVTCFESAHDTDASMTVDFHYDEDDQPVDYLNDSVWNFHVWNESWFRRPDLPSGYGGWQAYDATPQEVSEGVMRCGPAPVNAVKKGDVYLPHDTSFLFAEVNGDKVYWVVHKDGTMTADGMSKHCIGQNISTKAVGSDERLDLTHNYKHTEGTEEERLSVFHANKFSSRRDQNIYDKKMEDDVKFKVVSGDDAVGVGEDVAVTLQMTNTSDGARTVAVAMCAKMAFYTGITVQDVKSEKFAVSLEPKAEEKVTMLIGKDDYLDNLVADGALKTFIKASVADTKQLFVEFDITDFVKPSLGVEVLADPVVMNEDFEVKVTFTNPLPIALKNGHFHAEGSAIHASMQRHRGQIAANKEVTAKIWVKALRYGRRKLLVNFYSEQLSGIQGHAFINVKKYAPREKEEEHEEEEVDEKVQAINSTNNGELDAVAPPVNSAVEGKPESGGAADEEAMETGAPVGE
ncbi:PREDICTED: coagulation factor XIII A chain-like [Priapulus caudatus]|uniref:Coagulation factor XIII A chain-like n=1 Tax=Priapulus caudatus TaxID=37621 RepID=A0ABM1E1R2_PRICU|nr:PREDICTED: coagulation factor XIII A chain-like [Priapulus caudatus]